MKNIISLIGFLVLQVVVCMLLKSVLKKRQANVDRPVIVLHNPWEPVYDLLKFLKDSNVASGSEKSM